jgi:hypothetical protein
LERFDLVVESLELGIVVGMLRLQRLQLVLNGLAFCFCVRSN